jgi:uncharacterized protein (TIGR02466 family)|tara:strand:- start:77 stop:658 length:582 start_codon:yes stop_codon:yes gene_type:complete
MTDSVITFFPQAFYVAEDLLEPGYLKELQDRVYYIKDGNPSGGYNWVLRPYNTLSTYELKNDPVFNTLLNKIEEKTFAFNKEHSSDYRYKIKESWLNVYDKDEEQEYHCHPGNTYSAVFFLKSSKDCAKIIFENPTEPDMMPIKNLKEMNGLNFKRCYFNPVENSLLIFRSYMRHMVEKQKTNSERITVAVNM